MRCSRASLCHELSGVPCREGLAFSRQDPNDHLLLAMLFEESVCRVVVKRAQSGGERV